MGNCFSKRAPETPGTPADLNVEQRVRSFSHRTEMWERTGTVQCTSGLVPRVRAVGVTHSSRSSLVARAVQSSQISPTFPFELKSVPPRKIRILDGYVSAVMVDATCVL